MTSSPGPRSLDAFGREGGPLVTPAWLAAHLGDPDLRAHDCTGRLAYDPGDRRAGTHAGYRAASGRAAVVTATGQAALPFGGR